MSLVSLDHRIDGGGATWFMLRTAADFLAREAEGGGADPAGPSFTAGVSYDPARHVLELGPEPARRRPRPPSGLAVEPSGEQYVVVDGRLFVQRCDGSREPLPCEPGVVLEPRGLALDRRGLLYVADRRARQVVVIEPEDGRVEARLTADGMREPVDVVAAPNGSVYVADRGGGDLVGLQAGRIWRFDARFQLVGSWVPTNAATPPRPRRARPMAVLWWRGLVLVADEAHPRLLAFDAEGRPEPEEELDRLVAPLRERLGDAPPGGEWYPPSAALGLVGVCCAEPDLDIAFALAEVHAALRLLRLSVGRRFRRCGEWVSAVLDSGTRGTTWHRISVLGGVPAGTGVGVETATAERLEDLLDVRDPPGAVEPGCPPRSPPTAGEPVWHVLLDRDGDPLRFTGTAPPAPPPPLGYDAAATASRVREQLVQSPPGRYLRVRLHLHGDGAATPRIEGLQVLFPRRSYLEELPAVYAEDRAAGAFLTRYLALFERALTRVEDARDSFYRRLSPAAAPPDVLEWLGALLDLVFDPSWPLPRRRALVAEAVELYRRRGTPRGLIRYVEVYTGVTPVLTEGFLERPRRAATAGVGSVLGTTFGVGVATAGGGPADEALFRAYAHRFTVHIPLSDPCDRDVMVPVVDRIVEVNKPAHTEHRLAVISADARLDVQSTVGVDLVAGARRVPHTRLEEGPGGPVLGRDTVLGRRRPFPRPPDHLL